MIGKEETPEMFDNIASRYDIINCLLSGTLHSRWRKEAVKEVRNHPVENYIDLASGTGEMLLKTVEMKKPLKTLAVDLSQEMLSLCQTKVEKKLGRDKDIRFLREDVCSLNSVQSDQFDLATIAFGIRNVPDIERAFSSVNRILKKRGVFLILELGRPDNGLMKAIYFFYLTRILPVLAGFLAKTFYSSKSEDASKAYDYLSHSIKDFMPPEELLKTLESEGFSDVSSRKLMFGIVRIYKGTKK